MNGGDLGARIATPALPARSGEAVSRAGLSIVDTVNNFVNCVAVSVVFLFQFLHFIFRSIS